MDTYASNSWQAGNRENVDNRQYSSELQANGKHRNKVPTGLERMCPPEVVAHLPMAGLHLMENIQWIEEGL